MYKTSHPLPTEKHLEVHATQKPCWIKSSRKTWTIFNQWYSCTAFLLVSPRLASKRTKRVFFKIACIFLSIGIPCGQIDLAFPNIDVPNIYLCHTPSQLCGWYLASVLGDSDQSKQHASVSPTDWSRAAPVQHCKPPAFVLNWCVSASLMHACNHNTSPESAC